MSAIALTLIPSSMSAQEIYDIGYMEGFGQMYLQTHSEPKQGNIAYGTYFNETFEIPFEVDCRNYASRGLYIYAQGERGEIKINPIQNQAWTPIEPRIRNLLCN